MSFFKYPFQLLKKPDIPICKTPKSIQESIEVKAVSEDGIFEIGKNKYSKCYRFQDINYVTVSTEEQQSILERYRRFLNSLNCNFKITLYNRNRDVETMRRELLIVDREDGYGAFRKMYNEIMDKKILEGRDGMDQEMYLTIRIEARSFTEAKVQFGNLELTLKKAFEDLGAGMMALSGNQRLQGLYEFYHGGTGKEFPMDILEERKEGTDFLNDLCNKKISFYPDYFELDDRSCRALFVKKYPNGLEDCFLKELSLLPVPSMISVDVVPIPKELVTRTLKKKYLGVENEILKQQRIRNKNHDFSSDISYGKRIEKSEIEETLNDIHENDQGSFYVAVTILLMAENKESLERITENVTTIGKKYNCNIDLHFLLQREAFHTALPIGVRQVETMRHMFTKSLAALMPFQVQELREQGGNYYGINQISGTINAGNRKRLINGNGFVFGVPGSGKSFFCKMEMGNVFLATEDDIILVDPQNEYFDVAKAFGGTIINLSTYTENFVNPLEMDVAKLDPFDSKGWIREKCEFMRGLCEKCMGAPLSPHHKSIIDRCVSKLYLKIARSKEKQVPIMSDFYKLLQDQKEDAAKDLALALELFVDGSLNIFNHQTNVNMDNRFTVFGIRDLGTDLSPVSMLVMIEAINQKIMENSRKGKATWLYVDEIHVLFDSEFSVKYFQQLWKKVRKQGGLCTGITQNGSDLLKNQVVETMLSNSEFVVLLKQANLDSARLSEAIGVSEAQLKYVSEADAGTGLLKCGSSVIPFDHRISKRNPLYQLYNTNLHEKASWSEEQTKEG